MNNVQGGIHNIASPSHVESNDVSLEECQHMANVNVELSIDITV